MAIPNTSAIAQQIMQNGNSYIPIGNDDKQTEWQKMLAMLATADKMDAGTMAGFGLGKLLRGAFDTWKDNYDARGFINDKLAGATPEEQERMLMFLQENNPKQYNRVIDKYRDRWQNNGDSTQATTQPDLNGINPNARVTEDARNSLLGTNNAITNAAQLEVNKPFEQPNYDLDPQKYNMLEYIKRMGWNR